jgi:hypothetical protein
MRVRTEVQEVLRQGDVALNVERVRIDVVSGVWWGIALMADELKLTAEKMGEILSELLKGGFELPIILTGVGKNGP